MMRSRILSTALALGWFFGLIACSARNSVETVVAAAAGAAGTSAMGGFAGSRPDGAGGRANGGQAGSAGTALAGAAGASGDPDVPAPCNSDADCALPPKAGPCVEATCVSGACTLIELQKGFVVAHHAPADCRSDVCDGQGLVVSIYDPTQLPPSEACSTSWCAVSGAFTRPAPAGTACSKDNGGRACDGAGKCVQCLTRRDCAEGEACSMNRCASLASCGDQVQNGSETDVDCGGPDCALCADHAQCRTDQDCLSDTCNPEVNSCAAATCIDQKQDAGETDLDCGGSCLGCIPGQKCEVDQDCASHECDSVTHVCGGTTCGDKVEDGDETDVDCGGVACGLCQIGQRCNSDYDCADGFCSANVIPHVCS